MRVGTGAGGCGQLGPVLPNTSYTFSAWGKVTGGQWGSAGYTLKNSAGQTIGGDVYFPGFGASWGRQAVTFTTTADTAAVLIGVWSNASGNYLYVDDISLVRN